MTAAATPKGSAADAVFSYALGNLLLLPFWYLLFGRNTMGLDATFAEHYYEHPQEFSYIDGFAAVLLTICLAAVIFLARRIARRTSPGLDRAVETVLVVPPFLLSAIALCYMAVRQTAFAMGDLERALLVLLSATLVLGPFAIAVRRYRFRVVRALRGAITVTAPVGLVLTANAVAVYDKVAPADGGLFSVDLSLAPRQATPAGRPPVLLVIFDAWDHRLTFEARRSRLPDSGIGWRWC